MPSVSPTPAARPPGPATGHVEDRAPSPLGRNVDDGPALAGLGLGRSTLARLARVGVESLADLRALPPGSLWRTLGRRGVSELMQRMSLRGLPALPLTDYEKWRLGMVRRHDVQVSVNPRTPIAMLWPALGVSVVATLRDGGIETVLDLAPRDEADVRRLYRLGLTILRAVESLLREAGGTASKDEAGVIRSALLLIAGCGSGRHRRSAACRADDPHTAHRHQEIDHAVPD